MQIALAADHRVTDGVEAACFLHQLKGLLENPMRITAWEDLTPNPHCFVGRGGDRSS